ncbi:cytochrome c3 family protein [Haliea sp. E1-2-M8]|uniref:cytochrome c3 family protein n=1 Tax=Haliea sp. E1-2-M8 TaxID=3064706 RepID=UPI002724B465|nr:cytochrome c3 family protein [Haliea sp. E1-2-M8]MDO8862163.1 cytochrome c3 family protein [Haliea sp. E1-2-M8]
MPARLLFLTLMFGALATLSAAAAEPGYAEKGAETCIGCHDFGDSSPVHPLLQGAHGASDHEGTPMAERGCEECHGPSAAHSRAPTQVPPAVSFGPRWTTTVARQDGQCLACHGDDTARHWEGAHHQQQELACVTCHDIHTIRDSVLQPPGQAEVCTLCHKEQKSGIHGLSEKVHFNPACSSCHSPHDSKSPHGVMLDNRSEGCASCHNLVDMAADPAVSAKATSYHKVMAQTDKTCLGCHVGIAHVAAAGVAPLIAEASSSRKVTLFYPGQSDSEWLLSEHPGSQPLRQGSSCQQCHRGDEAAMGAALANDDFAPATRDINVRVGSDAGNLVLTIDWSGAGTEQDLAVMWGDDGNDELARAGCFAACHSDMPGMTRDRGQQLDKYLLASRLQERQIGRPPVVRDEAALTTLREAGNFAELWRVKLQDPVTVESGVLLAGIDWHQDSLVEGTARFNNGRWQVTLRRPLKPLPGGLAFAPGREMTLGIALHGADNPGGKHWISLPLTFATDGINTDFKVD